MPVLEIRTPEGIVLRRELAGAASRFAAVMVDLVVLYLLLLLAFLALMFVREVLSVGEFASGILLGGGLLIPVAYFWLTHRFMGGRTPGKFAVGLRVVGVDGYPVGSMKYLLRSMLLVADVLPIAPTSIGFVCATLTQRRQRLGDMVAGTLVVREPTRFGKFEPYADLRYSELKTRTAEFAPGALAKLDAKDLELLRRLLARTDLEPELRASLLRRAANHYAVRLGQAEPEEPRRFLRDLFLFVREGRAAQVGL